MASAARTVVGGASLLDEALVRALASMGAPEVRALHIKVVGGRGGASEDRRGGELLVSPLRSPLSVPARAENGIVVRSGLILRTPRLSALAGIQGCPGDVLKTEAGEHPRRQRFVG